MAAVRADAVIVGAGVVGLTTAYALARTGMRVCVLDRAPRVAQESSFMSSGQIEPVRVDHLAEYGNPAALGLQGAVRVATGHPRWTANYMHYCARTWMDPGRSAAMTADIRLLGESAMQTARAWHEGGVAQGIFRFGRSTILSRVGFPVDPADAGLLANAEFRGHQIATGSPRHLCERLKELCQAAGAEFRLGVAVRALEESPGEGLRITDENGHALHADRVVLCLGAASDRYFPHMPVWGFIREFAYMSNARGLFGTDDVLMATLPKPAPGQQAYVCLLETGGDLTLRLGGGALVGSRPAFDAFRHIAGRIGGHGEPTADWVGCRAVSPDGAPILGRVPGYDRVYANCGQSFWGWTLSFGCADLLAQHLAHGDPIPPTFETTRFLGS